MGQLASSRGSARQSAAVLAAETVAARSAVGPKSIGIATLCLFLVGWVTEEFSLIDFGRYSLPLLYFVSLPLCTRISSRAFSIVFLPAVSTLFAVVVGWVKV